MASLASSKGDEIQQEIDPKNPYARLYTSVDKRSKYVSRDFSERKMI
jgi:hypothetical protein